MALGLPIYLIVGAQPVSLEETPDGGMRLMGWDFVQRKMTRDAASWDDVVAIQPGLPVKGNSNFSEGDVVEVTKAQFDAAVARLERGESPT